ncbi:ATP-binding protein [Streptomyces sp. HSW2009]|uniref:ATP-binding protein n=1 Tax=Streptomyces sp. HSW2009 TaxID=3142890 RepID=UPI0032EF446F
MLEIVTVGALGAFLTAVGNGASGEFGRQLHVSMGALVRRTLGRETPLPATPEGWQALAGQVHPVLLRDAGAAGAWGAFMAGARPGAPVLRPGAGLPPATRYFTDRDAVLKRLTREASRAAAGRPRAALLYGPAGIGTSAVALVWGAKEHGRYPDGQFYVDLREGDGDGRPTPAAVVQRLLLRMGVEPEHLPATEADRVQLYRTLTAGRRALIVVDHATTAAQVQHRVPATPEVFLLVVVTGPDLGLEAERIEVEPLRDRDAVELLRRVARPELVAEAKPELPGLLRQCAGNPLALKVAARHLLDRVRVAPDDADGAADGGDPVRTMARQVSRGLRPETGRLCRLVALGNWPAIDARLAADAADVAEDAARAMLAEAAGAGLVEALYDARYRFRPGVRGPLGEAAAAQEGIAEGSAAMARTLDRLAGRALAAARAALPGSWRTDLGQGRGPYADEAAGLAALRADAGNLVQAIRLADEYGRTGTALRLARALWPYQLKAGNWDQVLPGLRIASRRAGRPGGASPADSRRAGALHFQLGFCLGELRQWEEAGRALDAAARSEQDAGHLLGRASCVEGLGLHLLYRWQYPEAYEQFAAAAEIYRLIGPNDAGSSSLRRALALIQRHQGRALRGMGQLDAAAAKLSQARDFFAGGDGEAYNHARTLTDLAEVRIDAGDRDGALAHIVAAEALLTSEAATVHLAYLAGLREQCAAAA